MIAVAIIQCTAGIIIGTGCYDFVCIITYSGFIGKVVAMGNNCNIKCRYGTSIVCLVISVALLGKDTDGICSRCYVRWNSKWRFLSRCALRCQMSVVNYLA